VLSKKNINLVITNKVLKKDEQAYQNIVEKMKKEND
jgi:hypothetical protein